MPQKSGSAKSGGSRSGSKGKSSTSRQTRQKAQASRGDAFQSPAQKAQVLGKPKGPGPVDRKALNEAEEHVRRTHARREARAQAHARGASEAEANRIGQEAYDHPEQFEIPPPIGSEEERQLLEQAGRDQLSGTNAVKSSGKSSRRSSRGKSGRSKSSKATRTSSKASVGEETVSEARGDEPSS